MFRNPRENAARDSEDKLKPSAGRAPSPPTSTSTHTAVPVTLAHTMPPKTRAMDSTAAKAAAKAAPSPAAKTTKASKNAKTKLPEKNNGNIMAFFRKVSEANESLFVVDAGSRKSSTTKRFGKLAKSDTIQEEDGETSQDEETRFHESGMSSKRRKTSHASREGSVSVGHEGEVDQSAGKPLQLIGEADGVDQQKCEAGVIDESKTKRAGPFLDDSDSEDEVLADQEDKEGSEETDATSLGAEVQDEVVAIKQEPSEDQEEQVEEDTEDITQEYPPGLLRQGTSYAEQDEFGDFEGNEDFDEEYAGGEEFSERRFAKEQRRLEMLEGGVDDEVDDFREEYGPDSIKEEPSDDGPPNGIPACPICASNLAGLSDQEASVHVNHCLDGNPTPLPVPRIGVKEEPESKAAAQPASAKFRRPVRAAKAGQENPFTFGTAETDLSLIHI